jgi:hypothetical protein
MAQVRGQGWDASLDILTAPVPVDESTDRKRVAQVMHSWVHVVGAKAQTGGELCEYPMHAALA